MEWVPGVGVQCPQQHHLWNLEVITNLGSVGVFQRVTIIQTVWKRQCWIHCYCYNDVIMSDMGSQITSLAAVYSTVFQAQIKENTKVPRHWPLCGESPVTGEFSAQKASNPDNVSVWWRHHDDKTRWWGQTHRNNTVMGYCEHLMTCEIIFDVTFDTDRKVI